MISDQFNQLRDTEIAVFGCSGIQSDHLDKDTKNNVTGKTIIHQTAPTAPTVLTGSKIRGAMFDNPMDRADQSNNSMDLTDQSNNSMDRTDQSDYPESSEMHSLERIRQPLPQQSLRMYDDDDLPYDPEKTKQATYQKVVAVIGDSVDREIVMDMVNRGMTAGKILNILIIS